MSNSLAGVHPELISEWSEKNLPLTPDKITFGSNKRVWWKGACGHEWETSVKARSKGEKCPICSGARVIEGINDLATLKPLLAQELLDIHCEAVVDGYTDFIFINRFGQPQHQVTLNKAIRRIIRDCNDEQLLKDENAKVLLPHFSCHSLRHTFTTRMCEAGVNVKVIQDTLGHKDISTTLNIYTDVTKELRRSEFEGLDSYFKNEYNKAANI